MPSLQPMSRTRAGRRPEQILREPRDPGEVVAHRLRGARAVPVVGVKDRRRNRVGELKEAAGILVRRDVAAYVLGRDAPLGGA